MSLICEYRRAIPAFKNHQGGGKEGRTAREKRHWQLDDTWQGSDPRTAPGTYFMTKNIFFYFGPECCAGIGRAKGMTYAWGDLVWPSRQASSQSQESSLVTRRWRLFILHVNKLKVKEGHKHTVWPSCWTLTFSASKQYLLNVLVSGHNHMTLEECNLPKWYYPLNTSLFGF